MSRQLVWSDFAQEDIVNYFDENDVKNYNDSEYLLLAILQDFRYGINEDTIGRFIDHIFRTEDCVPNCFSEAYNVLNNLIDKNGDINDIEPIVAVVNSYFKTIITESYSIKIISTKSDGEIMINIPALL